MCLEFYYDDYADPGELLIISEVEKGVLTLKCVGGTQPYSLEQIRSVFVMPLDSFDSDNRIIYTNGDNPSERGWHMQFVFSDEGKLRSEIVKYDGALDD